MVYGQAFASSWNSYPERYKFTGFDLYLDLDLYMISRTSYDVLNLTGDIGGLFSGLCSIGALITHWYND